MVTFIGGGCNSSRLVEPDFVFGYQSLGGTYRHRNLCIAILTFFFPTKNGVDAVQMAIAERYIDAFSNLAKTNNTMLLSTETGDVSAMVAKVSSSRPPFPSPHHFERNAKSTSLFGSAFYGYAEVSTTPKSDEYRLYGKNQRYSVMRSIFHFCTHKKCSEWFLES